MTLGSFDMSFYEYTVSGPGDVKQAMADKAGKVLLIVNTASKCGFTPQYEGLETLHKKYHGQGLEIMAFPCNQFGAQEPGDAEEIKNFCTLKYDVSFPLMAKIDVNGKNADPLWEYLKQQQAGLLGSQAIKWNFTKFLVDRSGKVVARHAPQVTPAALEKDIQALLAKPA
jgi:glutathione peroxidase